MDVQMNRYLFQWLFFAKLAERLREAVAGPPAPEEVPPRYVNDALYYACRVEQSTASRVLPFGSSLIAVIGRRPAAGR
jgi:hypothetical protein